MFTIVTDKSNMQRHTFVTVTTHVENIGCANNKLTGNDYWSFRLDGEVVGDYATR